VKAIIPLVGLSLNATAVMSGAVCESPAGSENVWSATARGEATALPTDIATASASPATSSNGAQKTRLAVIELTSL
jgi:hypothetical protein